MKEEWEDEPDFQDGETEYGYPLVIRRGGSGALCGYVGLPPEHPLAGRDYDVEILWDIEVHGGLTYAHSRMEGGPEGDWWFGFDCSHSGDRVPGMHEFVEYTDTGLVEEKYRNIQYVREQTVKLADQLKAIQDAE